MEPPNGLLDYGECNMHVLEQGAELEAQWTAAGLCLPDRSVIRRHRLERIRAQLRVSG